MAPMADGTVFRKIKRLSLLIAVPILTILLLCGCNGTNIAASKNGTFSQHEQKQPQITDQEINGEKSTEKPQLTGQETMIEGESTEKPAEDSPLAREQTHNSFPAPVASIPRAEASETTPSEVCTPAGANKNVYLTFDDGPNSYFTGPVLDILAKEQVRASFMVVGQNAQKNPDLIKRMIAEGHAVINHTYTHDYKKIYSSPEALLEDLDEANRVLESIIGYPVKLFRPPGGVSHLNKAFRDKLQENGYQSIGWNITGSDSDQNGLKPEQVYSSVVSGLATTEKLHLTPIILLHDGTQLQTIQVTPNSALGRYIQNRESVIAALPEIIKTLKSKDYSFAVVDENTPQPW